MQYKTDVGNFFADVIMLFSICVGKCLGNCMCMCNVQLPVQLQVTFFPIQREIYNERHFYFRIGRADDVEAQ